MPGEKNAMISLYLVGSDGKLTHVLSAVDANEIVLAEVGILDQNLNASFKYGFAFVHPRTGETIKTNPS